MAIETIINEKNYIGLSTDTKESGRPGETFTEVDTGKKWIWCNNQWMEDLTLIYAFAEALKDFGESGGE